MIRAALSAIAALALLAGCAATSLQTADKTVAQRLYQAQALLVTVQAGAYAYATQPWCGEPRSPQPPSCASPRAVVEIGRGSHAAVEAVKAAQAVAADVTSPQATILNKVSAAEEAITGLRNILAIYRPEGK